ncbi:MAG: hypothetical protein JXR80_10910 [Deltaproteobacteria bacterium]|nr:hypothetical protein [Deltaproteobacteria bacterium]
MGKEVNRKVNPETKTSLKIIQAGEQPPCLRPGFGFCRGCFGWENMLSAALQGDPIWQNARIHCSETGLTVTFKR